MLVSRCSSELSSHKLQAKSKKSQALSEAPHRFIVWYSAWWRGVEGPRRCLSCQCCSELSTTQARELNSSCGTHLMVTGTSFHAL